MADTIDHDHGSTGAQPPSGLNFDKGEFPDPEIFDWFWNQTTTTVNNHASQLDAIDSDGDGKVDKAEVADSATSYKNNDIDSDGDGKVDAADVADEVDHANVTNVQSDQHHIRYSDSEAAAAAPVQSVNGKTGDVALDAPLYGKDGVPKFGGTYHQQETNTTRDMTSGTPLEVESYTVDTEGVAFIRATGQATGDNWGDPASGADGYLYINGTTVANNDSANSTHTGSLIIDVTNVTSQQVSVEFEASPYLTDGDCTFSSLDIKLNQTADDIV